MYKKEIEKQKNEQLLMVERTQILLNLSSEKKELIIDGQKHEKL
jgi:hypothetical protein